MVGGAPPGYNGALMGGGDGMPRGSPSGGGVSPGGLERRAEVTIPVPEARVGAIIGKGGEVSYHCFFWTLMCKHWVASEGAWPQVPVCLDRVRDRTFHLPLNHRWFVEDCSLSEHCDAFDFQVISQLKNVVGVRIRISERDDFVPGTRDRKVTISGAPEAVRIAQLLIAQKVNASLLSCGVSKPTVMHTWLIPSTLADFF
jgi:KH domain